MLLADLRERADACLASESPSPAQARELAASALSVLAALEARPSRPGDGAHPYRVAAEGPSPEIVGDMAAITALERALDEAHARLAAAELALSTKR